MDTTVVVLPTCDIQIQKARQENSPVHSVQSGTQRMNGIEAISFHSSLVTCRIVSHNALAAMLADCRINNTSLVLFTRRIRSIIATGE
jgi:hypothetical protein